ncbi:MAG TPA: hypothetical protein VE778_05505 [Candidatus Bathyarchaeia archaeon]|jgi:hypothetical protein|nr:hypothetical protein [Candidatus Bathyarchaeia archaeon]
MLESASFFPEHAALSLIRLRTLPAGVPWMFTDDTLMALSIVELSKITERFTKKALAKNFALNYAPYADMARRRVQGRSLSPRKIPICDSEHDDPAASS